MAKKILNGNECREKILSGVSQLASTVCCTLGPKGRNVGIDKKWVEPVVLHDGVSVAKEIELPDAFENFGARLVRQAAGKTADRAGDGTTTATLLAWRMIEAGIEELKTGANPMTMKKGMDMATAQIVTELKKLSRDVKTKEQIEQVATVSSTIPAIGKMIAEALEKVGKEGVIAVEESDHTQMGIEYKEGMEFDKGYVSPHFATNQDKMETELPFPNILIFDSPLNDAQGLAKGLDNIIKVKNKAEFVFITPAIDDTVLRVLILNKLRGGFVPVVITAPAFAERRKEILEDIAVLTGATVISKDKGMKLEELKIEYCGRADSVWCNAERTKIIGGAGDTETIKKRADSIRQQIKDVTSDFEKMKIKERLARLISGVAIIKVGAMSEVEMKEKKERVIDAIEATKSAVEEGVVAGGGIVLYNIGRKIKYIPPADHSPDMEKGFNIVDNALIEPFKMLVNNAGQDFGTILGGVIDKDNSYGYNVETNKFGDLFEMGIIDPTRVTREALENAVSVASMVLTMESLIVDLPEEKKNKTSD